MSSSTTSRCYEHPVFNLLIPSSCPNVADNLLHPSKTWPNADNYDEKANNLAFTFIKNFEQYTNLTGSEVIMPLRM